MGVKLVKGRLFTERDNEQAPRVVVIAEMLARRYFKDEEPLGKRLRFGPDDFREIVGVVSDVKHFGIGVDARPSLYFSRRQSPARVMAVVVKTTGDPTSLISTFKSQVGAIDSRVAIANVTTMERLVSASIATPRFLTLLAGLFAILAMALAAIGVYGVISYSVTQRTHELGVRVALGASGGDVLKLVVGQGMLLAGAGVAIGALSAYLLTRMMTKLLYGVEPTDLPTFIWVSILLLAVAFVASYVPARRASRVDPMVALRCE
jgi:putative ABC transport system permease protein